MGVNASGTDLIILPGSTSDFMFVNAPGFMATQVYTITGPGQFSLLQQLNLQDMSPDVVPSNGFAVSRFVLGKLLPRVENDLTLLSGAGDLVLGCFQWIFLFLFFKLKLKWFWRVWRVWGLLFVFFKFGELWRVKLGGVVARADSCATPFFPERLERLSS